jgi:hypothetical protein
VFLIDAENDGLLEATAAFLQKVGDLFAVTFVRSRANVRSKSIVL